MSLREWLIAIGILVIIVIVIDGVRRMRRARKESMAISSGMGADDLKSSPLDDEYNPELPNGGARTISRNTLEERGYVTSEKPLEKPSEKPSQRPVENPVEPEPDSGFSSQEPDDTELESGWSAVEEPEVVTDVEADTARREPAQPDSSQPLAGVNRPEAQEVIVINVLARSHEDFNGMALKKLFEACGLQHGDMDIYHRHEESDTTSPVQFSVANAVEPGTFKPENMPDLTTPGISFFMSMPGPTHALQAFEFMLETAECVVSNLGGELKDERRSVMTLQTIEHCRQRIREFERKHRSQKL